jgi:putative membrane protein
MAYCIMFSPKENFEEKKVNRRSVVAFWSKDMVKVLAFAIVQAIVMIVVLHVALGFDPVSMGKTMLVASTASIAFMMLFYCFNLLCGKVGSFILLVFMVLQLSGSAGTYPIELSDTFFQKLHPYMPFTYTVDAFRSTTANGISIAKPMAVLFGIFAVFFVLNFVISYVKAQHQPEYPEYPEYSEEQRLAINH